MRAFCLKSSKKLFFFSHDVSQLAMGFICYLMSQCFGHGILAVKVQTLTSPASCLCVLIYLISTSKPPLGEEVAVVTGWGERSGCLRIYSQPRERRQERGPHMSQDSKSMTYASYPHWALFIKHICNDKIINNFKSVTVKH